MSAEVLEVTRLVYSELEKKGCKARIVPIHHIADIKLELESCYSEGKLDDVLYWERLTHFRYEAPGANSIIITSAPQPQQKVTFNYRGETYSFVIPPTYSGKTDETIEGILLNLLEPQGFHLSLAVLPQKMLVVHSGLAEYGKNNITYVEGMGSFHRLRAFFSDIPAVEDAWLELRSMKRCNRCVACVKKCPTEAIMPHRFMIRAERCLTFHNERQGQFPDWIDPSWHTCLVGCMECQLVCPVNKRFIHWFEETRSFDEAETNAMLEATSQLHLPETAREKLKRLYLLDDFELIPRNLGALIKLQRR